jgi:hypothetical protein
VKREQDISNKITTGFNPIPAESTRRRTVETREREREKSSYSKRIPSCLEVSDAVLLEYELSALGSRNRYTDEELRCKIEKGQKPRYSNKLTNQ